MRVLGLIPARGGSKGLPGKNTRPIAGQSLLERAIRVARDAGVIDRIVLSTDDAAAAAIARECGADVPFMRPSVLATDAAPMFDVVVHALDALASSGYLPDAIMLLQPTSPLRTPHHIASAVELLDDHDSVCSVVPLPPTHNPYYVMRINESGGLENFLKDGDKYTRRQDVPPAYVRDGTIYLTRVTTVTTQNSLYGARCRPLLLQASESLSIDTIADWEAAERRLASRSTN